MAIVTVFNSDEPILSSRKILKEHLLTFLDGNTHHGIDFPEAEVFLEERRLKPPYEKPQIRVEIPGQLNLEKANGFNEARTITRRLDGRISLTTSNDTGGPNLGETLAQELKDKIGSGIFHKFVSFLEVAGLDRFDVGGAVDISHSQLHRWSMPVSFVVEVAQNLIDPSQGP